jgi:hypothetical protein
MKLLTALETAVCCQDMTGERHDGCEKHTCATSPQIACCHDFARSDAQHDGSGGLLALLHCITHKPLSPHVP